MRVRGLDDDEDDDVDDDLGDIGGVGHNSQGLQPAMSPKWQCIEQMARSNALVPLSLW